MIKKFLAVMFFAAVFLTMGPLPRGLAFDVIPSKEYLIEQEEAFPDVLNIGVPLDCGDYRIQLLGQPIITKSSNAMVADYDLKYLIVRVGITNLGEESVGWLDPNSFRLQETYNGRKYGYYNLDYLMSAKVSIGFSQPAFFKEIKPGKMLQTPLVFCIFPEAASWIFTFAPRVYGEDVAKESVQFTLPKPVVQ